MCGKGFESGFTVLLKFFENFCSSRVLEENYLFSENSLSYIPVTVLLVSLGISLLNWMNVAGRGGYYSVRSYCTFSIGEAKTFNQQQTEKQACFFKRFSGERWQARVRSLLPLITCKT